MDEKVADSFNSLLREIDGVKENINRDGAKALQVGDYSKARALIDKGSHLESLKTEILGIQTKWIEIKNN